MATQIYRSRGAHRTRHARLETLLDQQDARLRKRRLIVRDSRLDATSGVTDPEEQALDAEEEGIAFSLLALTSRTVQGIETALQRLEAGTFGTCVDCQRRISSARLRAIPFAARCLACQKGHDSAMGRREGVVPGQVRIVGQ